MILIIYPTPPEITLFTDENGASGELKIKFDGDWEARLSAAIKRLKNVSAVGYFLRYGGPVFKKPVTRVTARDLKSIDACARFLPEQDDLSAKAAGLLLRELKGARHYILSDTAFFLDLPDEVSYYAVPESLSSKGIRRFGGYGLCHEWGYKKACAAEGRLIPKAVSVYLGDHTNLAAIKAGLPAETSVGFTPVEGIISAGGCGDIDPTILFNLKAEGMAYGELKRLLYEESGFSALVAPGTSYLDVISPSGDKAKAFAKELLSYTIEKYIGGFASVLGGIDRLIFLTKDGRESVRFAEAIAARLSFLRPGGKLSASVMTYAKERVMLEKIKEAEKE